MTDRMETHSGLTDERAAQLLAFEHAHPRNGPQGQKEEAIRRELGITPVRYWTLILRLIQTEQALRIDPITTRRLRRLTDTTTH